MGAAVKWRLADTILSDKSRQRTLQQMMFGSLRAAARS
jgi:hypothetical protein